jgi:hypothetical protein
MGRRTLYNRWRRPIVSHPHLPRRSGDRTIHQEHPIVKTVTLGSGTILLICHTLLTIGLREEICHPVANPPYDITGFRREDDIVVEELRKEVV